MAENTQATAVKTNNSETAGPPAALALPMVLKIPAPTIPAIPKKVKSRKVRFLTKPLSFLASS